MVTGLLVCALSQAGTAGMLVPVHMLPLGVTLQVSIADSPLVTVADLAVSVTVGFELPPPPPPPVLFPGNVHSCPKVAVQELADPVQPPPVQVAKCTS